MFRATYRLISNKMGKHGAFVSIWTDESLFRRAEANQHLHSSRASHVRVFEKPRSCPWKAHSAIPSKGSTPLVAQIRSRDQSPHRNSGIGSTVNNSSIAHSCISISLSLSFSRSLPPPLLFSFFFFWRNVALSSTLYWLVSLDPFDNLRHDRSACRARFSFSLFLFLFFGYAIENASASINRQPGRRNSSGGRKRDEGSFGDLSRVPRGVACGNQRKVDNYLSLF